MMQKRELGKSGIKITPLVLGGNVFGWTADEARSFEVLDAFIDLGGDMVDTAPIYSAWIPGNVGGESETVIGAWVTQSGKRDRLKIATKVGAPPENVARNRCSACRPIISICTKCILTTARRHLTSICVRLTI
jgi:aryl-alcohol dehydrogenase-like predicted oxidoreductase